MGRLALAYADFDACFGATVQQSTCSQETLNFRATAYYQGEICMWVHKHLDADILHFSIDRELDEELRELWAKQVMPHQKMLMRRPRQLKQVRPASCTGSVPPACLWLLSHEQACSIKPVLDVLRLLALNVPLPAHATQRTEKQL